jgi:hypothetical protein
MPLASNALTTLDTVKEELKISDASLDNFLTRKINAYSDFIEKALDRKIGIQAYDEYHAGTWRQKLILKHWPLIGDPVIKVKDVLLASTEYQITDEDRLYSVIFKETGWTWEGYVTGYVGEPTAPTKTIRVQYTAGYVLPKDEAEENPRTLPYELEDLTIQLIAEDYYRNGSQGLLSFSVSDVKWQWSQAFRENYNIILNKYRRYVV